MCSSTSSEMATTVNSTHFECTEASLAYNYSNLSIWKYLQQERGPQQLPLEISIPLTIVNVLIFVSGLLGNICVCVVIIRHPSMHTATNYYLFNLAVSDLTLLIFGLPNDVAIYWHQYPWVLGEGFCKLRALISEMATDVSVLTIVAFSTERYLAICYPLYLHTMSGLQRALRIIVCLWIIAFFSALPFSIYTGVDYLEFPPGSDQAIEESAICGMLSQPNAIPLAEISTLVFFIIPMLAIAVQYTRMGLKISKRTRQTLGKGIKGSVHRDSRKTQTNRAVVRMLATVVVTFFLCWAPFHAQRLLFIYGQELPCFSEVNSWMFFITGIFYYLSSTLNPILYNIMSDRYRIAFKEILCGIKRTRGELTRNSTLREVRLHSESHSNFPTYHLRPQQKCANSSGSTEEKMKLVDQEIITVSTPKTGNTLIYEINFSKVDGDLNSKCETRM